MSESAPTSPSRIADAIGLHIQELHAKGRLRGSQALLRIDNRDKARQAPFQFDAAMGQLHRTGCRSIPKGSMSALYGVWRIVEEEEKLACPRCNPMLRPEEKLGEKPADKPGEKPNEAESSLDLLYGVLSVIGQFGGVLRERGQEYRNSRAGTMLGAQIEKMYSTVNEREKNILDVMASSLNTLAVAIRELDDGLNAGKDATPDTGKASADAGQPPGREES